MDKPTIGSLDSRSALGTFYEELFAPTEEFFQSYDAGSRTIMGFAAPLKGRKPCAVELVVGTEVIAFSKAGRLSLQAYAAGLRFGWCGYELFGLSEAIAIDGDITVRCAVHGNVLHRYDRSAIEKAPQAGPVTLSARELLQELRLTNGTSDLKYILPFLKRYSSTHGTRDIVEALYRYIFRRSADESGLKTWTDRINEGTTPEHIAETLWSLAKYENSSVPPVLQGPFEPGFTFGLELFD